MITAIVLTHNDEKHIARCLASLTWCDEIIIIDDYSTDTTVAVAEQFTTNIFRHRLNDDFSAQRNFALSKAKGEWVLFVDSDEVISEDLRKEIEQKLDSRLRRNDTTESRNIGYYITRKDWWGGQWLAHGETANVRLLRLAKKNAGIWTQPVHETWNVNGTVGKLVHPILHYPHPDIAQFLDEINRYSSLYAAHLFYQGIREPWWHIIVKPMFKFFHNYLIRLGFLDGTAGAVVAIMMSLHSFLVRGKLWLLWHKSPRNSMS